MVDVLSEILDWSADRPAWQRDALRRLVTTGSIDDEDLQELASVCKAGHGLAEPCESSPLGEEHIATRSASTPAVSLKSVVHHAGVNALAPEQRLTFKPGLTVVYGANATGKSGFTRILKRACRARGAEEVLGNVLSDRPSPSPSATVSFAANGEESELPWDDPKTLAALGHVSVFDGRSAMVYLTEKTDVAFRPLGLDLFDKLSDACERLREGLEEEKAELARREIELPHVAEGTAVRRALSNLTPMSDPDEFKSLGSLSDDEQGRLETLRQQVRDLQSSDPRKTAGELEVRVGRLDRLAKHVLELDGILCDDAAASIFSARNDLTAAGKAAEALRAKTLPSGTLVGTGAEVWRAMWEAARRFSDEEVYPEFRFPPDHDGARCLLCQQVLEKEATERMTSFESFVTSTIQSDLDRAKEQFDSRHESLSEVSVYDDSVAAVLDELRLESDGLSTRVDGYLEAADARRRALLKALEKELPAPNDLPPLSSCAVEVSQAASTLRERSSEILRAVDDKKQVALVSELDELLARQQLGSGVSRVLEEIDRKKRLVTYTQCLQDTHTRSITLKSSDLTRRAVTTELTRAFEEELKKLRFTDLGVELQVEGGERGSLYHRICIRGAESVELQRVLSEGEARCLSIAAFFSELTTQPDPSAILFDDPVSSLDCSWRECVAKRLVDEAASRQVIVFTHDIVFLQALSDLAQKGGVPCSHQRVQREARGAGVASPELPWIAMPVRQRIGALKSMWQHAEKLHRTVSTTEYEKEAVSIYGFLREAWERGLEETLLNDVVERFRPSIETRRAKCLSDIKDEDYATLEAGMSKCSQWLRGHDTAPAAPAPVPPPDELRQDIDALEKWRDAILKRRKH